MNDIKYTKIVAVLNIIAKENKIFDLNCTGDSTEITAILFSFLRDLFEQNIDILEQNKNSIEFKILEVLREHGVSTPEEAIETKSKFIN